MERSTSTGSWQKTPGLQTRVMGWCMVHHEDQDICNNCEENLIFMTRAVHARVHGFGGAR